MDLEKYTQETIVPSRSKFQLRHFVIGQHDTPQMQWRQILIEAQDMAYKIRMAELSIKKMKIEIEQLLLTGDRIDEIEAEEKELNVALTELTLSGARMEFQWLKELAEEVGEYSFQEIEEDQPRYWGKRLQRQADTDVLSIKSGITVSNLQSMLNSGLVEYEPMSIDQSTK